MSKVRAHQRVNGDTEELRSTAHVVERPLCAGVNHSIQILAMLAHVCGEIALLQPSQAKHHPYVADGYGLVVDHRRRGCQCFGHGITITTFDYKVNTLTICNSVTQWCICNHMRLQTQENKTAQIVLDLLDTRNMTQSALADEIGLTRQALSSKINGTRSFTKKDYVALADFFDTSVDYLMGRTLDPWPVDNPQPEEAAK